MLKTEPDSAEAEVVGRKADVPGNPQEEEELELEEAALIIGKPVIPAKEPPKPICTVRRCLGYVCLCGALFAAGFLLPLPRGSGSASPAPAGAAAGGQRGSAGPAAAGARAAGPKAAAKAAPGDAAQAAQRARPQARPEAAPKAGSRAHAGATFAPMPNLTKPTLDLGQKHFDPRQLEAPVSRSVLALGVPSVIPWLTKPRYEVFYMDVRGERVLEAAWEANWAGMVWQGVRSLPFSDFAFDALVVGAAWCVDDCGPRVVDEWLRVLRPGGKLIVWDHWQLLPVLQQHPLLQTLRFANLFERARKNVVAAEIPVCASCGFGNLSNGTQWSQEKRCQPRITAEYAAPDAKPRVSQLQGGPVEQARVWYAREENAYLPKAINALKGAHNKEGYLGVLNRQTGKRYPGRPLGWQASWFRGSAAPRRVLDAGAGTCNGHAWLALEGLLENRLVFNYGFYDCSFAAICAERGDPTIAWDWNLPLPICSNCKFDLVNQVGGMHHQAQKCKSKQGEVSCAEKAFGKLLRNFDQVLACRGFMWLYDRWTTLPSGKTWHWSTFAASWARSQTVYQVHDLSTSLVGNLRLEKKC